MVRYFVSKNSIFPMNVAVGGGLSRSLVSLPPRKSNSAHNKINVGQFQVGNRLMLTNEALEADFPLRIRLGCISAHVGTDS